MGEHTRNIDAGPNDDDYLARLGYKQEFKRDFSRLELFGLSFSIVGVVQSIAYVRVPAAPHPPHLTRILQCSLAILHPIWRAGRDDMGRAYWSLVRDNTLSPLAVVHMLLFPDRRRTCHGRTRIGRTHRRRLVLLDLPILVPQVPQTPFLASWL
jgi:hypothetical protein